MPTESWLAAVAATLVPAIAALGAAIAAFSTRLEKRSTDAIRDRLLRSMELEPKPTRVDGSMLADALDPQRDGSFVKNMTGRADGRVDAQTGASAEVTAAASTGSLLGRQENNFTRLLVEYYAYGLSRTKSFSNTSLVMSIFGGIILVTGVGAFIFQEKLGITATGATVTTAAGLITNGVSVLFHRQANNSLHYMKEQAFSLRDDMIKEREMAQAIEQLQMILDPTIRDHLRSKVILRLAGVQESGPLRTTKQKRRGGDAREAAPDTPRITSAPPLKESDSA